MDADQIIDRRRLKRKLVFWRVVGLLAIIAAIAVGAVLAIGPDRIGERSNPHIARIAINGFISDDRDQLELIERLGDTDAVKAVLVSIDSPGGATVGGEALYDALRKLSAKKPTVASIKTLGASAAYMAAIATDHVVAYKTSITGSIGVLFQSPEVSEAMAKLGIKLTEVKSSPLKASPSPFEPATPEALAVIRSLVDDSYDWFVGIVADRRKFDRPTALRLSDGRVYSGNQALAVGLIDAVGGEEAAVDWLVSDKGVAPGLRIIDWKKKDSESGFSFSQAAALFLVRQAGLDPQLAAAFGLTRLLPQKLGLDGLQSVWQAPAALNGQEGAAR